MKVLELKPGVEGMPSTVEFITVVLQQKPAGGFDLKEMRERFRILDAAEKADDVLELEDADAKKLQGCVEAMRWTILDRSVMEFTEAVLGMKEKE